MDSEFYFYVVTALAVVYSVFVRLLQNKLMDKSIMKEVQEKSKQINELYKEAAKHNDKRKMEQLSKMNEELMPKMNAMFVGQMKMMVAVLAVFFVFMWISGQLDPTAQDDFSINLTNTRNGIYSGSFVLNNTNPFWYATAKAYADNAEIAMNQTVFFVGPKTEQILWIQGKEVAMPVYTDKESYSNGERVTVYAEAPENTESAIATLSNGTRFYVDLPITIPLINLQRIYDSQNWFIFSAVIIGLLVNPVISLIDKYLPKKEKKENQ